MRGKGGHTCFPEIFWFGLELAVIQFDNSSPSSLLSAWLGWMWARVTVAVLLFKEFPFWFFEMLTNPLAFPQSPSEFSYSLPSEFLPRALNYQNPSKPVKAGCKSHHFPSTRYDLLLYNTDRTMNYFSLTELCGLPGTQWRSVLLKIF